MSDDLTIGPDGRVRCWWGAGDADYVRYHDEEWGRPVHGDTPLFERIVLEGFQSGLSWLTILRKRESFAAAFHRFDPAAVAAFGTDDVERLMGDPGIVRNRRKIEAAVTNARATVALTESDGDGALDRLVWSFAPKRRVRPAHRDEIPAVTAESTALARHLKAHGFAFVGPTTMYALMQACGLVDDHLDGCHTSW